MFKLIFLFFVFLFANAKGSVQRIAGGSPTEINKYPFAVALLTNNGQGNFYTQACAGTIITNRAILSAASCFYTNSVLNGPELWRARVGSTYANSRGMIYIINLIIVHENYVHNTQVNDLAILRTNLAISYDANVAPAKVAGVAYPYTANQMVWAIGWGVTNTSPEPSEELREVQMWLINQQNCQNSFASTAITVNENMVCAGLQDVGTVGQCAGDVGGPLLDSEGAVIGVFSRTQGCGDIAFPSINTRVASFTRWIVNTALSL
ncbi:hypothetical protein HW555_011562 [Spodoptera exigua]|uniref:Peptidase S1 domain-containing protein n=1 Tax=Spodoptera exigua TaxID=7107 RepID=A0A835G7H9_SPOEX|nr:hypothetical protein HW555_011562 [Spodoptera exigua]